jgi:hypothetical protein
MAARRRFVSKLERPPGIGKWTCVRIPRSVFEAFDAEGRVMVRGTIDGRPFKSAAIPAGDGTHLLVVSRAIRETLGVTLGDRVRVVIERDTEGRRVDLPADFRRVLWSQQAVRTNFEKLSYQRQKEYVEWIESARRGEARATRIEATRQRLLQGLPLKERS